MRLRLKRLLRRATTDERPPHVTESGNVLVGSKTINHLQTPRCCRFRHLHGAYTLGSLWPALRACRCARSLSLIRSSALARSGARTAWRWTAPFLCWSARCSSAHARTNDVVHVFSSLQPLLVVNVCVCVFQSAIYGVHMFGTHGVLAMCSGSGRMYVYVHNKAAFVVIYCARGIT